MRAPVTTKPNLNLAQLLNPPHGYRLSIKILVNCPFMPSSLNKPLPRPMKCIFSSQHVRFWQSSWTNTYTQCSTISRPGNVPNILTWALSYVKWTFFFIFVTLKETSRYHHYTWGPNDLVYCGLVYTKCTTHKLVLLLLIRLWGHINCYISTNAIICFCFP